MRFLRPAALPAVLLTALLTAAGCSQQQSTDSAAAEGAANGQQVVVYTALDRQFSEPILREFEDKTGIAVQAVYDAEAVKTVGLVNRLLSERDRPVADVFWNNEIVRTIQLKREGVTQPYVSPSAETIPASLKDPEGHWAGFAARARVIMVNPEMLAEDQYPTSIDALTDPAWAGQGGFAKPLFGTTSTHAAAMWALLGEQETMDFWTAALENGVMYAGNAQARDAVADGEIPWCWTDTDDAYGAIVDGKPAEIIYGDSIPGERDGVMVMPNTVTLIAGAPNEEAGKMLIDYLLSEEVEAALAQSRSAQIPVRDGIPGPQGIPPLPEGELLEIDWDRVADALTPCQQALDALIGSQ